MVDGLNTFLSYQNFTSLRVSMALWDYSLQRQTRRSTRFGLILCSHTSSFQLSHKTRYMTIYSNILLFKQEFVVIATVSGFDSDVMRTSGDKT